MGALAEDGIVDLHATDKSLPDHTLLLLNQGRDALDRVRDAMQDAEYVLKPDVIEWHPPVYPGRYLDFYAFEEHTRTARAKRGLDVVPEWYEIPAYYNGNHRAFIGHGHEVRFPPEETKRDFELELAIVIGKPTRDVDEADALDHVAGYSILNDWSARATQVEFMKIGLGPAKGKDFATGLGPVLVIPDPDDPFDPTGPVRMQARVNGETWADNDLATIHHPVAKLVSYASEGQTLLPGDVLGTGTVGGGCGFELDRYLSPGDEVELEIDGIGVLRNRVAA